MMAIYNNNGDIYNLLSYHKSNLGLIAPIKIILLIFISFMIYIDIKQYNFNKFNIISLIILKLTLLLMI